ncbi:MAG: cysteine desulfurase [Lachnospiraceae bacterium]|nr:cysteine desulfurase [Lachnospiraceae bacterium]
MADQIIYMDNAATTKTRPEVVEEMLKYFTILYGNPSSVYEFAGKSRDAIENARQMIASTLGAKPNEIYFTSGGTESDNWALRAVAKAYKRKGRHIITSKIEHHAILNTAKNLEDLDYQISYIDVDEYGVIKLQRLKENIKDDTILISVMTANNEIGTIQPIDEIGRIAKSKNVIFHTDAVQYYCHLPIDVKKSNIDLLSASAHKFNGPKGVGFLYISENLKMVPLIFGGSQESGLRAGTQNVPSIVGMAKAAEIAHKEMNERIRTEIMNREYFIGRILREIPYTRLNGARKNRLPGNMNFSFQFVQSFELLAMLDMEGICVSAGSACSSESKEASHVLTAIGLDDDLAHASLRFTISEETTKDEIDHVIETLKKLIAKMRKGNQLIGYYNKARR